MHLKCKYEIIHSKFFPPVSNIEKICGYSTTDMERFLYGFTQIVYRCKKCGLIKPQEVTGDLHNKEYLML